MTHPPEWLIGEPCPVCGSPDILECELRINADKIEMGWECRECGYSTTWTADADNDEGHMIERRIVEQMPLHAITALYGERGLRERFAAETARLGDSTGRRKSSKRSSSPDGSTRSTTAARAVRQPPAPRRAPDHRPLRRSRRGHHLRGTAPRHGRRPRRRPVARRPPWRVRDAGRVLRTAGRRPGRRRHQPHLRHRNRRSTTEYRAHVAASLESHPWARVLKASDFTDNGVGLIYTTGPKAAKSARKYAPLVPVLADLIARQDTPLTCQAKARILRQLDTAQERFAAIARRRRPSEGR